MAGFFYLCYTGSVHKIGEEVKLLKDYDWWVKAWNAYNNPPTKTIPLDASDALQGKITSVVVLVIAIVLCEGTPSFRAVVNHAGLFWFSMYRFSVFNGAPPAVPA